METAMLSDYQQIWTPEQAWEWLRKSREDFDKRMQENDKLTKEIKEQMKETDRRMQETDRKISRLGNRFGELVEHLVAPGTIEKFNKLGFHFTEQSQDKKIFEPDNPNACTEIDILLENGEIVIAVEVKSKPVKSDVDDHVKRMEVLRRRADQRHDTRKFCGAIAGAVMDDSVRKYALRTGMYVLEQTGDTVEINIPEGFIPREW
ncbi:MAG: hypothetical protein LBH44_07820 [Treponema sp.]|jgi:hypothetical protein|nr:hypothetical protein [Treponema sp.]